MGDSCGTDRASCFEDLVTIRLTVSAIDGISSRHESASVAQETIQVTVDPSLRSSYHRLGAHCSGRSSSYGGLEYSLGLTALLSLVHSIHTGSHFLRIPNLPALPDRHDNIGILHFPLG